MDATKAANRRGTPSPDPINDPCLVRGVDTNFEDPLFMVGGSLVLPKVDNKAATAEILEIKGPEEIRLKRGFKGGVAMQQLTGRNDMTKDGTFINGASAKKGVEDGFEGINFLVAPKLRIKPRSTTLYTLCSTTVEALVSFPRVVATTEPIFCH